MKGSCKRTVWSARTDEGLYLDEQPVPITSLGFAWTEISEFGDPITLDWMIKRKFLLQEFVLNLATWRKQYRRDARCGRSTPEMNVTEYGAIATGYCW
jgi:hypothetical protein